MTKKKLLEDIKSRPARFYRMPSDVVRDRRFDDIERLEILRAWTQTADDDAVARQLDDMVATLENRAGDRAAE